MDDILQNAYNESVKAYEEYMSAERKLAMETGGFIPKDVLDNIATTKRNWQEKHNIFHTLLSKNDDFNLI